DLDTHLAAVSALRRGIRPLELALACEEAGLALAGAGRRDEGISLLTEAVQIYEHLRAGHDAARALSSLRSLGAPRRSRREPRPSFGWPSLTKTELEVVKLVAEGLTNRQVGERLFVSRRTVATHMEHVFQKLGLATRVQVAAEVSRRAATGRVNPEARTGP
ncbi:MAG: response regulator transcription factor, partial [Actinomycetota bacterium]